MEEENVFDMQEDFELGFSNKYSLITIENPNLSNSVGTIK